MRLINSRQAWHDAYYPNIKSPTAFGLEALRLGIVELENQRQDNSYQVIHQWLAGRVQHCIESLPLSLQCFGHYLYSPIASLYDLEVAHKLVWSILSKQIDLNTLNSDKQKQAYWLVRAVLKSYQSLVVNKKDLLKTPKKVTKFMEDNYQVILEQVDWKKVWQPIYNRALFICGELDKQALQPVNLLVNQSRKAK